MVGQLAGPVADLVFSLPRRLTLSIYLFIYLSF